MPIALQKIEPASKKARIVDFLREAIISGEIQSGEQIVEGKLAQQLGVGQGVIREALIELEHHGFVQRMPFSGTQVTELTLQDAQQIYDIRIELEPLAFFLAGPNTNEQQISDLTKIAENSRSASQTGDLDSFFANVLAFRKMAWALSGNRHLQQILERMVIPPYALYVIRQQSKLDGILQTTIVFAGHQDKILVAYKHKNFEDARETARSFLKRMKETLGMQLPTA
jgi:DNA-binding GntR family transcriptional regulator